MINMETEAVGQPQFSSLNNAHRELATSTLTAIMPSQVYASAANITSWRRRGLLALQSSRCETGRDIMLSSARRDHTARRYVKR